MGVLCCIQGTKKGKVNGIDRTPKGTGNMKSRKQERKQEKKILTELSTEKVVKFAHKERVAQLVVKDQDLIEMLFQYTPEKKRTGPKTPAFADGVHKEISYLTGTNVVYLRYLVQESARKAELVEQKGNSKSTLLNRMIEFYLENNQNAGFET